MKQQLLVVNQPRRQAPNLSALDRFLFGFWSLRTLVLPDPREDDPEEPIRGHELRTLDAPLQDRELLAKGQVLKDEVGAVLGEGAEEGEQGRDEGHGSVRIAGTR